MNFSGSMVEAFLWILAFSASTCTGSKTGLAMRSPNRATASTAEFLSVRIVKVVIYLSTSTEICPPNRSIAASMSDFDLDDVP